MMKGGCKNNANHISSVQTAENAILLVAMTKVNKMQSDMCIVDNAHTCRKLSSTATNGTSHLSNLKYQWCIRYT